jgi:hypothetical protein
MARIFDFSEERSAIWHPKPRKRGPIEKTGAGLHPGARRGLRKREANRPMSADPVRQSAGKSARNFFCGMTRLSSFCKLSLWGKQSQKAADKRTRPLKIGKVR